MLDAGPPVKVSYQINECCRPIESQFSLESSPLIPFDIAQACCCTPAMQCGTSSTLNTMREVETNNPQVKYYSAIATSMAALEMTVAIRICKSWSCSRDWQIRRLLTFSPLVGPFCRSPAFVVVGSRQCSLGTQPHLRQRHNSHQDCSLHNMGWLLTSNDGTSQKGHSSYQERV